MHDNYWTPWIGAGLLGAVGLYFFTRNKGGVIFAVGQRVAVKSDVYIQGVIRTVIPQIDGSTWYDVIWDSPDFMFNPIEGSLLIAI